MSTVLIGGSSKSKAYISLQNALLQVRLAYAGKELDPDADSKVFTVNPNVRLLQAVQRMKGGRSISTPCQAASRPTPAGLAGTVAAATTASAASTASTTATTTPAASRRRRPAKATAECAAPKPPRGSEPASVPAKQTRNNTNTNSSSSRTRRAQPQGAKPAAVQQSPVTRAGTLGATADRAAPLARSRQADDVVVMAPGAGAGSAEAALAKQFRDIMRHPMPGVSVAPDDTDTMKWHVKVGTCSV